MKPQEASAIGMEDSAPSGPTGHLGSLGSPHNALTQSELPQSDKRRSADELSGIIPAPDSCRDFAFGVHEYIRDYIQLADQKAAVLIASLTALLAYLEGKDYAKTWIKPLEAWTGRELLSCVAVWGIVVGVFLGAFVVLPRLAGRGTGLVFWKEIAAKGDASDYSQEIMQSTTVQLDKAVLNHCHALARVCSAKYSWLNRATWIGAVGALAGILQIAFF